MSGICGVLDHLRPFSKDALSRFTASLHHRGESKQFIVSAQVFSAGICLADPSAPQHLFGGANEQRYFVALDGAIYNAESLRAELQGLGCVFKSKATEELIYTAYLQWGIGCLSRFNGGFVVLIWDNENRELFLARDRFGEKPLYLLTTGSRLAFASELKAFLALDDFVPALDETAARMQIAHGDACEGGSDLTLLRGVRRLMPGQALTVGGDGKMVVHRWWDLRAQIAASSSSYPDQVAHLRDLLQDATQIRDGQSGALCLGSGLGSGALFGLLPQCATLTMSWEPFLPDESCFVGDFLGERGKIHRDCRWEPKEWMTELYDAIWRSETANLAEALPITTLYHGLRRHDIRDACSGLGAGDIFAGKIWHLDWPLCQINDVLLEAIASSHLPAQLTLHERSASAQGISLHLPFLDWRIVTFALSLKPDAKIGQGFEQRVLRDALLGTIPDMLRLRRTKSPLRFSPEIFRNESFAPILTKLERDPISLQWHQSSQSSPPSSESLLDHVGLTLWHNIFVDRKTPAQIWN